MILDVDSSLANLRDSQTIKWCLARNQDLVKQEEARQKQVRISLVVVVVVMVVVVVVVVAVSPCGATM